MEHEKVVGMVDLSVITSGVCWEAPLQQDTGNIQGAALREVVALGTNVAL